MSDRSSRREVRNPLLTLPAMQRLARQDVFTRADLVALLKDIRADAQARADQCWRKHKGPMAVYWKCIAVYAGHLARVLGRRA